MIDEIQPVTRLTDEDYQRQLQALLPSGKAWPRDADATLSALVLALAGGYARADGRAHDLVEEADPRTALEMLADWERVCNLPDECATGAETIQERRAAVVERLTARGDQSLSYFQRIATALGYDNVTFTEYRPFVVGQSACGEDHLNGDADCRFHWRCDVHDPRVTWFRCGESQAGIDPLGKIDRAEDLECRLNKLKPAHAELHIGYEGA